MATKRKSDTKITIDVSLNILDTMVRYIFTENTLVTRRSHVKLKELMDIVDDSIFENDRAMEVRFYLVNKLLEGMITDRIIDFPLLAQSVLGGGQYDDEIQEIYEELDQSSDLSNDEVVFMDNWIGHRLQYSYLFESKDDLEESLLRLSTGDYHSLKELNEEFEEKITDLFSSMKKAKAVDRYAATDFDLSDESLDIAVTSLVNEVNSPSNMIRSGIKWLNKMVNGGFEAGRVYLFLGLPGGWKSGLLLNIALWGHRYNKGAKTQDPTKKPCILYVTQENSTRETLERIYSNVVEETDLKGMSVDEILTALRSNGFNNDDIDIKIMYRPNKSISTSDLDAFIDDLAMDGLEVVMLIHDYVKRIRPAAKVLERHLELGAVVDEYGVIAKTRNIPVIGASQLNREGYRVIEAGAGNKANVVKGLGASHAGESIAMIENADFAAIINKEIRQSTKKEYITIKKIKMRGKDSPMDYFAHEFENGMRLKEDFSLSKSLSMNDLGDDLAGFDPNSKGDDAEESAGKQGKPRTPQVRQRPIAQPNKTESLAKDMEIII